MSDELKCGYGRFDEVKSHPLIRGPLATLDERNAATIATLRTQLAAMTAERDAALAKVAVLREALMDAYETVQSWADYAPKWAQERHGLITDLADIRNALEATK